MEQMRFTHVLTCGLNKGRACDGDLVKLKGIIMCGPCGVSEMETVEDTDLGARAAPCAMEAGPARCLPPCLPPCLPLSLLIVSSWSSLLFCQRNSYQPTIVDVDNT